MADCRPPDRRLVLIGLAAAAVPAILRAELKPLAFEGAQGWAARVSGGRGGQIIRVTTLAPTGLGSLHAAVSTKGPRIIVFEVGGVIDLGGKVLTIHEPLCTIAGQTAPDPGITLIRGGLVIEGDDVVIRHIRIRPGSAGFVEGSGWECDAINVYKARGVIVDHCSLSWGTDENLSASGPRFTGATPSQWRGGTSRDITFSNNIVAEGLSKSTHGHGEHSKGSLFNYNVSDVLVTRNLYASNRQRNPLFGGGTRGAVVNNLIHNPGTQALMLSSQPADVGGHLVPEGLIAVIANVLQPGPATIKRLALLRASGGTWRVLLHQNLLLGGAQLAAPPLAGVALVCESPLLIPNLNVLPNVQVREHVLTNAGARPWARDRVDARIVAEARSGTGRIIDDQAQVGGYPVYPEVRRRFDLTKFNSDMFERERI